MKLDFEQYFADALTALIRRNGGSIEEALDDIKIKDGPTRGSIKHWYGWDEDEGESENEEGLPNEFDCYRPSIYDDKGLEQYIRKILHDGYGYKPKTFKFDYDERRIYVYQITWDTKKGGK